MSKQTFMLVGHAKSLLLTCDAGPMYPGEEIKVYDIGDDEFVGVTYPDNARQCQPMMWWLDKLRTAPAPIFMQDAHIQGTATGRISSAVAAPSNTLKVKIALAPRKPTVTIALKKRGT